MAHRGKSFILHHNLFHHAIYPNRFASELSQHNCSLGREKSIAYMTAHCHINRSIYQSIIRMVVIFFYSFANRSSLMSLCGETQKLNFLWSSCRVRQHLFPKKPGDLSVSGHFLVKRTVLRKEDGYNGINASRCYFKLIDKSSYSDHFQSWVYVKVTSDGGKTLYSIYYTFPLDGSVSNFWVMAYLIWMFLCT